MNRLRFLRLPAALAVALTLMACAASGPITDQSVFDTLARADAVRQQRPSAACDTRFEVKSCRTSTGIRNDGACECIPRETLRDFRPF
jgi:hypothetical protein